MARRYVRDAKGRFAGKGFSGQTGGRGARLKSGKGKKRAEGGAIVKPTRIGEMKNTISKSSSKRKVNASSRATDRQIARDVAARSKPAAAKRRKAEPKDGTDITREIGRKKGNKRIKNLNQQIKEAGTNAAGLRLEKLSIQTRMPNKPRQRVQPTAKQSAKEASRNDAIRKRSAELRAQSGRVNRAYANQARTADTRNKPGSSMIRRPSRKTTRGAIRAEQALSFYRDPKRALKSVNKKRPGFRLPRGMRK